LENGATYTLIPVDDHTVATLNRIEKVYKTVTEKPARLLSTQLNRIDELIQIVGLLFEDIEYTSVENKQDLQDVIKPPLNYEANHSLSASFNPLANTA
jgi:ribosome assembly protein YihI (activator of Der GTPase)